MLNLSLQIEKYPRDLLQRFRSTSDSQQSLELTRSGETGAEIELNLGLSLGGRFGVDKNAKKKLLRSSSIAGSIPIFREIDLATTPAADDTTTTQAATYPTLIRASSLPTETEEEWRKRKELQTLRRMEAKRRRSEKQRNSSSSASINSAKTEVNLEDEKHNLAGNRTVAPPFGMQSWAAAARQALLGGGVKGGSGGGFLQGLVQPCSQGSVESQGGSSSGITELESKPLQGMSSGGEARTPLTVQALQDRSSQEAVGSSVTNINENACHTSRPENLSNKLDRRNSRGREMAMNTYEDMPCVFTKGDGPNGRKIEGILYRYGKGEEVRIMCVCHGSFLSPAEFVKHAGGGDVDHPLRHIVVNPAAAPFS
ncbi:Ninja-family protein AFP2 [Citrus sinensis]|nr:Ninja-family protein AFP2 [Citrus sinensis]